MEALAPWLAVAALGALHGVHPASGWWLAAACAARPGEHGIARMLLPLAGGHVLSMAVVAGIVSGSLALGWEPPAFAGHGAGWMLVPALTSFCASDVPARAITASGSLGLVIAAVALHLAAMVAASAAAAWLAARGWRALSGRAQAPMPDAPARDGLAEAGASASRAARA